MSFFIYMACYVHMYFDPQIHNMYINVYNTFCASSVVVVSAAHCSYVIWDLNFQLCGWQAAECRVIYIYIYIERERERESERERERERIEWVSERERESTRARASERERARAFPHEWCVGFIAHGDAHGDLAVCGPHVNDTNNNTHINTYI